MKTSDAAKSLGIHPLNLLLKLQPLVPSLEECWPMVDDGFIETLKHLDQKTAFLGEHIERGPATGEHKEGGGRLSQPQVSAGAAKVIEKLWRKSYWGKKEVSWDTLRSHYCQGITNLEGAVAELVRCGYLTRASGGHAYSLNQAYKAAIEDIASSSIAAHSRS